MITGMENTFKAMLLDEISAAVEAATGSPPAEPNVLPALSEGIAVAAIDFLTANAQVASGIPVQVSPSTGTGATTSVGSII